MLYTTEKYVIPWIKTVTPLKGKRVLEIGCGEGGNLLPFENEDCEVVGVDCNPERIRQAEGFILAENSGSKIHVKVKEATALRASELGKFELIILKDFIEHIDREKFLPVLKELLSPNGLVFFGFPPWMMPYGGHQQVCRSRFSRLPWLHLLPKNLYLKMLSAFGESDEVVNNMGQNYDDGLNIETLQTTLKKSDFRVVKEQHFLINPGYDAKFGLRPRNQLPMLNRIAWVRNFYTTCCYLLVSAKE